MEPETRANLTDRNIWVRIIYMLFFLFAYSVAEALVAIVAIFQTVVVLVTGRANDGAMKFGTNLTEYIFQVLQFETFNSEYLAFPFSEWPDKQPDASNSWSEPAPDATDEVDSMDAAPTSVNESVEDVTEEVTSEEPADDADPDKPAS